MLTTQSDEAIAVAAIYQALEACSACAVIDDRLHYHSVPDLVVVHAFSNFFYHAAKFMAERQRNLFTRDGMRGGRADVRSVKVLVKVWIYQYMI
jgi:hypothetical protein